MQTVLLMCVSLNIFLLTSCYFPKAKTNSSGVSVKVNETENKKQESKIVGSEKALWKSSSSIVGKGDYLEYLQVFDENSIYILGESGKLYTTTNRRITWEIAKINLQTSEYVSSITFSDTLHGFAAIVQNPTEITAINDLSSRILETNDGGKTWQKKFEMKAAEFRKIILDNEQKIWIAGRKTVKAEYIENLPLILMSKNGNNWEELNPPEELDSIVSISIKENSIKSFIDTKGQIFELSDKFNWKKVTSIEDVKPQQIRISHIEMLQNKIYLMGATGGREGTWTSLFIMEDSSKRWKHLILNNVILRDAVFVTSEEILACGTIKNTYQNREQDVGIILHSFDSGYSWLITYESENIKSLNRLWTNNAENIIAIGENGFLLELEKKL